MWLLNSSVVMVHFWKDISWSGMYLRQCHTCHAHVFHASRLDEYVWSNLNCTVQWRTKDESEENAFEQKPIFVFIAVVGSIPTEWCAAEASQKSKGWTRFKAGVTTHISSTTLMDGKSFSLCSGTLFWTPPPLPNSILWSKSVPTGFLR